MASPALESFCCMFRNSTFDTHRPHHPLQSSTDVLFVYNVLCITSSTISILGAAYQLYPKKPGRPFRTRNELRSFMRQNIIICWLALADLLASVGILLRSVLWISGPQYLPETDISSSHDKLGNILCAVTSGWVQFFYLCTYFWTFCYAFDVYLLVNDKPSWTWTYHVVTWTVSALLSAAGLVALYHPSLLTCERKLGHLLPHYLATYIPILLIMIANPILMVVSSKSVRSSLMRSGRYTDQERGILSDIRTKFILITLVFYVCWSPNILNGIFLLLKYRVPRGIVEALWTYMAVTNPLQAFLNTLVYRGAGGCNVHLRSRLTADDLGDTSHSSIENHLQGSHTEESTETSPLLNSRSK